MENFFGSVLNVEKKFLFLKILKIVWRKVGALLDNGIIYKYDHKSENSSFDNYRSLIFAELELIQRVFEIRQNFSDSERLVEPILQRICKIKSEKSILEKKFNNLS